MRKLQGTRHGVNSTSSRAFETKIATIVNTVLPEAMTAIGLKRGYRNGEDAYRTQNAGHFGLGDERGGKTS